MVFLFYVIVSLYNVCMILKVVVSLVPVKSFSSVWFDGNNVYSMNVQSNATFLAKANWSIQLIQRLKDGPALSSCMTHDANQSVCKLKMPSVSHHYPQG